MTKRDELIALGGVGVKVKPLEWPPRCPRGQRVHNRPALVNYTIAHYGGDVGDAIYRWAEAHSPWSDPLPTYEAAKAAAQADYERRILSALEAPAAGDGTLDTLPKIDAAIASLSCGGARGRKVARARGYADRIRWLLDNKPGSLEFVLELHRDAGSIMEAIDDLVATGCAPDEADPLDDLVRRFSVALLEKLKAARVKYGYDEGWRDLGWKADCQKNLIAHLAKGDPSDVAAYCAFMWHHGWSTTAPDEAAIRADEREKCAKNDLLDAMQAECWTLRCVDIPTGCGDADVVWEVVQHHMAKPHDRVIATGSTPREALAAAIRAGRGE